MSSSDGGGGGTIGGGVTSGDPSPHYFCHQCNDSVSISPSSFPDVVCPNCNSGFLEELETPIPNRNPNPPFVSFTPDLAADAGGSAAPIPLVFPGAGGPGTLSLDDLTALFGNRGDATGASDPIALIQNYVQTIRAGGADAQFTVENSGAGETIGGTARATFRIPVRANFTHGDYFFGPGIEELIQQLTENDLGPQGTPPASRTAVEGLPDITVTEELLASDNSQCAVCKDTFELGKMVKQMPCKHIYHADCILPWLERHSSCPVCRYVLPTDDPDYEEWRSRRSGRPQANRNVFAWPSGYADSSSGGGGGGDNMQPMMDRRLFRMPSGSAVPFSGSGGGSEGGGGGGEGGGGGGGGGGEGDGGGGGEGDGGGGSGDNMQPMVDRRVFSVPVGPADSSGGGSGSSGDNMLRVGGNMPPIMVESRVLRLSLPSFQQLASTLTGATILGNNNNNNNTTSGNNSGQSNSESRGNQNFESETRQEDLD